MDMMDEVLLRFEALKEEYGDLAGVYCHINNICYVDSKRESEVLQLVKSIVLSCIAEEYAELKGYERDPDGKWVKNSGGRINERI